MNLKKIFLLLVTALFLLSLYGCNTSSSSNNSTEQTTVTDTDDSSLDTDTDSETEFNYDLEIYYNDKKIDNLNLFVPSQSEFFVISKHFTATPRIPPTLCVLKETSSRCSADVERLHFTTRLISGLRSL